MMKAIQLRDKVISVHENGVVDLIVDASWFAGCFFKTYWELTDGKEHQLTDKGYLDILECFVKYGKEVREYD